MMLLDKQATNRRRVASIHSLTQDLIVNKLFGRNRLFKMTNFPRLAGAACIRVINIRLTYS